MTIIDPEAIARPSLLLTNSGEASSFKEASAILESEEISIIAGIECASSTQHQAALLTAVNTARRVVGHVHVITNAHVLESLVLTGPFREMTLLEALVHLRAEPAVQHDDQQNLVAIGSTETPGALRVTWEGWTASVLTEPAVRHAEDDDMPLAPIAAASLAVSEVFQRLRGHLEAGRRDVNLSLWDLPLGTSPNSPTPRVEWLPGECTLIGLGHLGQAYAWCLSHLPFAEPALARFRLQDFDHVTRATVSTGLLTFESDIHTKKTRVVARAFEAAGLSTSIIEQRLSAQDSVREGEPQLALIGVDNLETRRLLSGIGWGVCIDAGLGQGPNNYTRIRLQMFPGAQSSEEVQAWQVPPTISPDSLSRDAYIALHEEGVDECGLVMIAGKAIAVTFVGAVAACMSVAVVLRILHDGPGLGVQTINLSSPGQIRGVGAESPTWYPPALHRK